MSGRYLAGRVVGLEQDVRHLRADLDNLPVRRPPPVPFKLLVDHQEHESSTQVRELGINKPGRLHDVWKVLEKPDASRRITATTAPGNKLAFNLRRGGEGHSGGYTWADVIDETGMFRFSRGKLKAGIGRWDDLVGAEGLVGGVGGADPKKLNMRTTARWNNGNGAVGPIAFAEEPDVYPYASGPYTLGVMLYQDGYWWPAFEQPWEYGVKIQRQGYPIDCETGPDNCRVLTDAAQYQKGGTPGFRKVWALRLPGSTQVNVAEHVSCNRRDIDFLFRLIDKVDCHHGELIGQHDNFLDQAFNVTGGTWDTWALAVTAWIVCANNACFAIQMTCTALMQAVKLADGRRSLWTPICPVEPKYEDPAYLTCPQISG